MGSVTLVWLTTCLAYCLIAVFFGLEGFMRQGARAKDLKRGEADAGSTLIVGSTFGLAVLLGPGLDSLGIGRLDHTAWAWAGILAMLVGIGVRVWSMRTLGEFYTRT